MQDKNGTGFVCLDGNFRLCRRKKAGQKSINEIPLSGDGLFADQSDVDQYLHVLHNWSHWRKIQNQT